MTCRHQPDDTSCSSHPYNPYNVAARERESREAERVRGRLQQVTPDADNYEILEVETIDQHLVLKVRYPNCTRCAYEGTKVMVFLNTPIKDALKWKRIDPHFQAPAPRGHREAPSPAARFPASDEGWRDAIAYAKTKIGPTRRA